MRVIAAGHRFGRYTVIEEAPRRGKHRMFLCRCDCGNEGVAYLSNLTKGHTQSCGCYKTVRMVEANIIHGEARGAGTVEFNTWLEIRRRCFNPNCKSYKDYGARGITMHEGWRNDYPAFVAHVGRKPTPAHSIERINNELGYEPGNVTWATRTEQNRNTRATHWVEFRGERKALAEWAAIAGLGPSVVLNRLKRGWSVERTLTEPAWIGKNQSNRVVA